MSLKDSKQYLNSYLNMSSFLLSQIKIIFSLDKSLKMGSPIDWMASGLYPEVI